jgi:glycosyltransferase involved in cell wall biosynthesis
MTPFVSVIIPCRNEVKFLARCLDSILSNHYPAESMEVLVADGRSSDGTRELIAQYADRDPRVRMIDNPRRITPCGLNLAIRESHGSIVLRVDAHAAISLDYIGRAVRHLETSGASNVGGRMNTHAIGDGPFAEPISLVLTHRFGVGNSHFRTGSTEPRWVDTVFGGCWPRRVFQEIGGFNEQLVRSQDMEFNLRLARRGGKILLAPDLETEYWARADFNYFVRHNWANGVWAILPFAYSEGVPVRARHVAPLGFVVLLLVSLLIPLPAFWLRWALLGPYLAVNLAVSLLLAVRTRSFRNAALLPLAFLALHWVYGAGSLWGAFRLALIYLGRAIGTCPPAPVDSLLVPQDEVKEHSFDSLASRTLQ